MPNRDVKIRLLGQDQASPAIGKVQASLGGLSRDIAKVAAGYFAIDRAVAAGSWAIKLAADSELMRTQLTTMLGSIDKANKMLGDLTKFAADTPFELNELADASKKLIAFGVDQEKVIGTMRRLGDIASGLGIPLSDLVEIYGKARVQGRLFAEDINQLTGRGIPVIQEFAKQFGVTEDKVRGLVSSGKIGFAELEKAIVSLTDKGSIFGGGMDKASKTLAGQWSTLKDDVAAIGREFGESLLPGLKEMVALSSDFAKNMNSASKFPLQGGTKKHSLAEIDAQIKRLTPLAKKEGDSIPGFLRFLFPGGTNLERQLADWKALRPTAAVNAVADQRAAAEKDEAARQMRRDALFARRRQQADDFAIWDRVPNANKGIATVFGDALGQAFQSLGSKQNSAKGWLADQFSRAEKFATEQIAKSNMQDAWRARKAARDRLLADSGGPLGAVESRFLTRGGTSEPPMVRELREANRIAKEDLKETREQNRHLRRIAEKKGLAPANF